MSDAPDQDQAARDGRHPVFVAFKLSEARTVEELLTHHGIDFVVEVEVLGRTLFGLPRNGALFSVPPEWHQRSMELIVAAGLEVGLIPMEIGDETP